MVECKFLPASAIYRIIFMH